MKKYCLLYNGPQKQSSIQLIMKKSKSIQIILHQLMIQQQAKKHLSDSFTIAFTATNILNELFNSQNQLYQPLISILQLIRINLFFIKQKVYRPKIDVADKQSQVNSKNLILCKPDGKKDLGGARIYYQTNLQRLKQFTSTESQTYLEHEFNIILEYEKIKKSQPSKSLQTLQKLVESFQQKRNMAFQVLGLQDDLIKQLFLLKEQKYVRQLVNSLHLDQKEKTNYLIHKLKDEVYKIFFKCKTKTLTHLHVFHHSLHPVGLNKDQTIEAMANEIKHLKYECTTSRNLVDMLVSNKIANQNRLMGSKERFQQRLYDLDVEKLIDWQFQGLTKLNNSEKDLLTYFGHRMNKKIKEYWDVETQEFDNFREKVVVIIKEQDKEPEVQRISIKDLNKIPPQSIISIDKYFQHKKPEENINLFINSLLQNITLRNDRKAKIVQEESLHIVEKYQYAVQVSITPTRIRPIPNRSASRISRPSSKRQYFQRESSLQDPHSQQIFYTGFKISLQYKQTINLRTYSKTSSAKIQLSRVWSDNSSDISLQESSLKNVQFKKQLPIDENIDKLSPPRSYQDLDNSRQSNYHLNMSQFNSSSKLSEQKSKGSKTNRPRLKVEHSMPICVYPQNWRLDDKNGGVRSVEEGSQAIKLSEKGAEENGNKGIKGISEEEMVQVHGQVFQSKLKEKGQFKQEENVVQSKYKQNVVQFKLEEEDDTPQAHLLQAQLKQINEVSEEDQSSVYQQNKLTSSKKRKKGTLHKSRFIRDREDSQSTAFFVEGFSQLQKSSKKHFTELNMKQQTTVTKKITMEPHQRTIKRKNDRPHIMHKIVGPLKDLNDNTLISHSTVAQVINSKHISHPVQTTLQKVAKLGKVNPKPLRQVSSSLLSTKQEYKKIKSISLVKFDKVKEELDRTKIMDKSKFIATTPNHNTLPSLPLKKMNSSSCQTFQTYYKEADFELFKNKIEDICKLEMIYQRKRLSKSSFYQDLIQLRPQNLKQYSILNHFSKHTFEPISLRDSDFVEQMPLLMQTSIQQYQHLLKEDSSPEIAQKIGRDILNNHERKCGMMKCSHLLNIWDRVRGKGQKLHLPQMNVKDFW